MHIAAVGCALPPHRYDQDTLIAAFQDLWGQEHHNVARVEQMHRAVLVEGRNLALPMEAYRGLRDFGESNDAFIAVGTDLAEEAVHRALDEAGLRPSQVDALFFSTVTGI